MRLDNPRHERFAQAVARGAKGAVAYREVYGAKVGARKCASALLKNEDISGRVAELQDASASSDIMAAKAQKEWLTKVIMTPINDIDETSILCQSAKYTQTGRELKMVCKLGAMTLLARLMGLLKETAPVALNVNVTVLTEERREELMRRRREAMSAGSKRERDKLIEAGQAITMCGESL